MMSTCPDLDLYSVYLDNELPEQYKESLESHLAECSECRKKFEKMESLHEILASDSSKIVISDKALENSFEKLQARRSYKKYMKNMSRRNDIFFRRVLPAMAAALVIALVLPIRMLGGSQTVQQPTLKTYTALPEMAHNTGITMDKSFIKSVVSSSASDNSLQKAIINTDLTSALQNQILTSIDIFGSDIKTNKIQITIDLSNVSGITPSEKEGMKLIQIPVSFPSEGQK